MAEIGAAKQSQGFKVLSGILNNATMKAKFEGVLEKNAGAFMASILDLYQCDSSLQECDPSATVLEALKAATLKLPINKSLGFAYIVPYSDKTVRAPYTKAPHFQLGYRGMLQLAQRSGQYKYINCGAVCEGETVTTDRLSGMVRIEGTPTSDKAIGYFAYFQLINGFEKAVYMTRGEVESHAKRFSKAYGRKDGPWTTQFDAMAQKTVLLKALRFGPMNVEMAGSIADDREADLEAEVDQNANGEPVILPQDPDARTIPETTTATQAVKEPDPNKEAPIDDEYEEDPF